MSLTSRPPACRFPGPAALVTRWKNRAPGELIFLIMLLTVCMSIWAFLAIADEVQEDETRGQEERLMLALRNPANLAEPAGPVWLTEMARDISALGGATVITLMSLGVSGYMLMRGRWRRVLLLAVTIAGGHLISYTLKGAYVRERPSVVPHLAVVKSHSFPSGHSLSSSVVYLTMGALLAGAAKRQREKVYVMTVAFGLTFIIGLSRVFLGVHYPTDVLAGWSAGTAWALGCWLVASHLRGRAERKTRPENNLKPVI